MLKVMLKYYKKNSIILILWIRENEKKYEIILTNFCKNVIIVNIKLYDVIINVFLF